MTLVGALLILIAACLIGAPHGALGFVEAWAIVGVGVMVGVVVGIFWSLPRFVTKSRALTDQEAELLDDAGVERMFKGHMSRYAYGCALVGYVIGVLVAMAVV